MSRPTAVRPPIPEHLIVAGYIGSHAAEIGSALAEVLGIKFVKTFDAVTRHALIDGGPEPATRSEIAQIVGLLGAVPCVTTVRPHLFGQPGTQELFRALKARTIFVDTPAGVCLAELDAPSRLKRALTDEFIDPSVVPDATLHADIVIPTGTRTDIGAVTQDILNRIVQQQAAAAAPPA